MSFKIVYICFHTENILTLHIINTSYICSLLCSLLHWYFAYNFQTQTNTNMVNLKHILKHTNVGIEPVTQWYQSKGSRPWDMPTSQNTGGIYSGRYLLRETPNRLY